jgi:hypothetical protein
MSLHKNDIVRLTPNGPVGQVTRLPRQQAGEPSLAYVRWTATGKVSRHDQRTLIVWSRSLASRSERRRTLWNTS